MAKKALTKKAIDALRPQAKDVEYWDEDLNGFFLIVTPKGKKSFYAFYRNKFGQKRKVRIGTYGPFTPEKARDRAKKILQLAEEGGDPAREKAEEKELPTFDTFADKYLKEYAEVHKKESSVREDRNNLKNLMRPFFGNMRITEIQRADVLRFQDELKDKPTTANRCLALLSKMMNLAEAWGFRQDATNPCRHVKHFKEHKRERFLTGNELATIDKAIDECEALYQNKLPGGISPFAGAAIRLLILTGCRCGEILNLEWSHVDLDKRCLRLPDSKTGAKTVHINQPAIDILKGLSKSGLYVLQDKEGGQLANLNNDWRRVLARTKLSGIRLHDLRHSYASVAAGQGVGLQVIGKLLGHTKVETTARYAHLQADPLRAAAEAIGEEIAKSMRGEVADVVDMAAERVSKQSEKHSAEGQN